MSATLLERDARAGIVPVSAAIVLVSACAVALIIVPPEIVVAGALATCIIVAVAVRPAWGAYLVLAVGPLLAGIDRGTAIPLLRPSEALTVLVGAGLVARAIATGLSSGIPRFRPSSQDVAIVLMAVASSILPLLWMLARGIRVEGDDVLYGLLMWKFVATYVIFRAAVKTERETRICLWVAVSAGAVVASIAILQSIGVGPVVSFVAAHFAPYGNVQTVVNNRGGATLGLPIAAADLLLFDLAIAAGFLVRARRSATTRLTLFAMMGVSAAGVLASGEFSAVIGLVLALIALAVVTRRADLLTYPIPALLGGLVLLRPVIERRLAGFQSTSGLPVSWTGRLYNLRSYFWPELFTHDRFVLGVRLAARVVVPTQATGYVWIESGYTWLLWSGGLPLLAAFVAFAVIAIRRGARTARARRDAIGTAGLASCVGVLVVTVLMVLDPHLTYRGAADLLFALIALAAVRPVRRGTDGAPG